MNHARPQNIHLLSVHFQFSIFNFQLFKDVILSRNLTLPVRPIGSRDHLLRQLIPHHEIRCRLYRTEKDKFLCRRFQKIIKNFPGQSRVYIKISLRHSFIFRIMRLSRQMHDRIYPFHSLQLIPRISLCHPLFFRRNNIQPIKNMPLF